jgi:hypothetical protein
MRCVKSAGTFLCPVNGYHYFLKGIEASLYHIKRMGINERCLYTLDNCWSVVDLQMNWTKVLVRVVLMPSDENTPIRFNPIDPVVFVWITRPELESDLNPPGWDWILGVI